MNIQKIDRKEIILVLVFVCLIAVLLVLPTGFQKQIYRNAEGVRAKVLSVNNEGAYSTGLSRQGAQSCVILIETGSHKGEQVEATNFYIGRWSLIKYSFRGIRHGCFWNAMKNNNIVFANMVEQYRANKSFC